MSNKVKTISEVLVVGAGPVGMFTALRLAENGIGVQLIDQESCTAGHSYACALHPRTLQLLDEVGIAQDAIKLGHLIETVAFYEGAYRRADIKLSLLPVQFPFVLVLPQNAIEDLLEQKLKQKAGVEVRWNHRLADLEMKNGVATATIDELAMEGKGYSVPDFEMAVKKTLSINAEFVVGADGQGSIVRQRLNIDYERVGKPQLFEVYEFETNAQLPSEIRIVLDKHMVGVLWPFTQNKGRWSIQWLRANALSDFPPKTRSTFTIADSPGPDDNRHHLHKLLSVHAPWFQAEIKDVGWVKEVQFEDRLARQFGRDRAWLAGDAAHQTGPVGMQSMNMGFCEGADLAGKLTRILRDKGSSDLLENYDLERRMEWEQLLGLKGGPQASALADEWTRGRSAQIPACIPASGMELTLLLHQLGLEFKPPYLDKVEVEGAVLA
jgi:2-polyprenyl-6-methoxyphenol hydroxylase-like FAD-dependent oxidoreductase